jgi:hypothetical protein
VVKGPPGKSYPLNRPEPQALRKVQSICATAQIEKSEFCKKSFIEIELESQFGRRALRQTHDFRATRAVYIEDVLWNPVANQGERNMAQPGATAKKMRGKLGNHILLEIKDLCLSQLEDF